MKLERLFLHRAVQEKLNVQSKSCTQCHKEKPITDFSKQKTGKFGVTSMCKECDRLRGKKYYLNNKDNILKNHRFYRKQNPDYDTNYYKNNLAKKKKYVEEHKEEIQKSRRLYSKKNRKRLNKYMVDKRKTDIQFRLAERLRNHLRLTVKDNYKSVHTLELLGCSVDFLKKHLESQFKEGMNWSNYTYYGWHIDHIKPCCSFDLTKLEEQRKCFHYSNLQPLWREENQRKGGRCAS